MLTAEITFRSPSSEAETPSRGNASPAWLSGIDGDYLPKLILTNSSVVRVVAGPGSGKTTGLKRFVLRLVERDRVQPDRIFVGSFTRVIAAELREKLGETTAGKIHVSTLHSLAVHLLRSHLSALQKYNLRFLLSFEEDDMLYDVSSGLSEAGTIHDRRKALKRIQSDWAERQTLRDAKLCGIIDRWLRRHRGMLIGEVLPIVTRALDATDIPRGQFDYVVVDEYQDLTACEQLLVEQVWSGAGSLIVLGDDDQSIYRFRFNHPGGISEFSQKWSPPLPEDIPLPENRRSASNIVTLANRMMAESGSSKLPMIAMSPPVGATCFVHWGTLHDEIQGLASYMRAKANNEFLVLVPRKFIGRRLCAAVGADASTNFHQGVLGHPLLQERFILASCVADPNDLISLRAWFAFKTTGCSRAQGHNSAAWSALTLPRPDDVERFLAELADGTIRITGSGARCIKERARLLVGVKAAIPSETGAAIEFLFNPELCNLVEDDDDREDVRQDFETLRSAAIHHLNSGKRDALYDIIQELRYRIATRAPLFLGEVGHRVRIMTLHSAKGLEADHVIVAGMADEIMPGIEDEDPDEREQVQEEQRRLLYVAVTRAKTELIVSWPKLVPYKDASKNRIRIERTFRTSGSASPVVQLTKSRLLPKVTDEQVVHELSGASWLKAHNRRI